MEKSKNRYDLFYDYIYDYIRSIRPKYSKNQVERLTTSITTAFIDNGYTYKLLREQYYRKEIDDTIKRYDMRLASVRSNDKNEQYKTIYKPKKKNVPKSVIVLLLAVILTFTTGNIVSFLKDQEYMEYYTQYDNYSYPYINTIYNENYSSTCSAVISAYDKLSTLHDENYSHLGFYKAYCSIQENRLAIMDDMLEVVQRRLNSYGNCPKFYDDIKDCPNFLRYVYNRLIAMGCDERDDLSKFLLAIEKYEKVKETAAIAGKDVIPYDELSQEYKTDIEKYMELYRNKCKECLIDLGKETAKKKK